MYNVLSIWNWNTANNNLPSPHLLSDRITGHPTGYALSNTDTSTFHLNCRFSEAICLTQFLFKEVFTASGLFLEERRREIYKLRNFIFYLGICLSPRFCMCACTWHLTPIMLLYWMLRYFDVEHVMREPGTWNHISVLGASKKTKNFCCYSSDYTHRLKFLFQTQSLIFSFLPLHYSYYIPNLSLCKSLQGFSENGWQKKWQCWGLLSTYYARKHGLHYLLLIMWGWPFFKCLSRESHSQLASGIFPKTSLLGTENIHIASTMFSYSFPSLLFPTRNYLPQLFNSSLVAMIQGESMKPNWPILLVLEAASVTEAVPETLFWVFNLFRCQRNLTVKQTLT